MSFESAPLKSSSDQPDSPACPHVSRPCVLIIEDDPQVAHVTHFILGRSGFDAVIASTPEEGLHLAVELRPGAILCEAALPRMSGSQVLRILKKTPETAGIPVIVMSGNGGLDCPGIFTFLTKPFDSATLVGAIRNALQAELQAG